MKMSFWLLWFASAFSILFFFLTLYLAKNIKQDFFFLLFFSPSISPTKNHQILQHLSQHKKPVNSALHTSQLWNSLLVNRFYNCPFIILKSYILCSCLFFFFHIFFSPIASINWYIKFNLDSIGKHVYHKWPNQTKNRKWRHLNSNNRKLNTNLWVVFQSVQPPNVPRGHSLQKCLPGLLVLVVELGIFQLTFPPGTVLDSRCQTVPNNECLVIFLAEKWQNLIMFYFVIHDNVHPLTAQKDKEN